MTREEALSYAKAELQAAYDRAKKIGHKEKTRYIEILEMTIKALEQESFMTTPCISSKVCEHDRMVTLDKIRAEIESLSNANPSYWHSGDMVEREEVFEIIDKYKAESEDKE